ncbi:Aspartyl protease family protein At5g10770 [Linum grandiflorum]
MGRKRRNNCHDIIGLFLLLPLCFFYLFGSVNDFIFSTIVSMTISFEFFAGHREGATILEMKHKDFCTSSSPTIQDWTKKQHNTLILDNLRVHSIQSRKQSTNLVTGTTQIPLASGIRLETLNYIVTVQLGGKQLTVIMDTGSDLTWVQCQPCRLCYNQKDPLFNPSISPSFQRLPCNSSACKSLEFATGNSGVCGSSSSYTPSCNYFVSYGDGSYTRGDLATEKLNLGGVPFSNFIFGCGRNNKGLFGGASGLMGLGRSDLSLVSQSESIYGGVFSYCLPTAAPDASGSLAFGANTTVYNNFTPISYTRMVPNPQLPTFYFLNLTGITVGGKYLQVQDSSFGSTGILIDSGTVISRLPPSLYNAVKAEFLRQLTGVPSAPSFSILDTCFNLTGYREIDIPTISMNFEWNVELEVDLTGVFYFAKADASQVCLAITSLAYEGEIGIVGNYQQRNKRVVYDTRKSMVGFAAESCSFS